MDKHRTDVKLLAASFKHKKKGQMKISINKYPLHLRIGHFDHEKQTPRTVTVDLILELANPSKDSLEQLEKTIDYGRVLEILENDFSQSSVNLLETLSFKIAERLVNEFQLIEEISVKIEKSLMRAQLTKGSTITVESSYSRGNFL